MTDAPRAVLVTVGDELLNGETVDSNAAWLGRELSRIGLDVVRRYTVGDVAADIRDVLGEGLEHAEVVLLTGGLGPTDDDLTRPVVAEALDAPLRVDDDILDELRERFRRHGYDELPASNWSQAEVPEGAEVLANPRGTAPGLLLEAPGDRLVVLLPGVPAEMKGMVSEELLGRLERRLGDRLRPVRHRVVHTTGVSESELADRVAEALPRDTGPVSVAFLPDVTGVDVRLSVRGGRDDDEARHHLDRVEEALEEALEEAVGGWRYEAGESGDLVEPLSRALADAGHLLATGESCTGGLVAKRMTDRPGSSDVFVGGIVAYSNAAKVDLLDVESGVLEREGAVSGEVARQMATGAARRFGVTCGVGITGVAGPGGGTEDKPVGLVWYAAAVDGTVAARRTVFPGDRDSIRRRSAQAALALLLAILRDDLDPDRTHGPGGRRSGDAAGRPGPEEGA